MSSPNEYDKFVDRTMPAGYQFDEADTTNYVAYLPQFGEICMRRVLGSSADKPSGYVTVDEDGNILALARYSGLRWNDPDSSIKYVGDVGSSNFRITRTGNALIVTDAEVKSYGWNLAQKSRKESRKASSRARPSTAAYSTKNAPIPSASPLFAPVALTLPDDLQLQSNDDLPALAAELVDNLSHLESEESAEIQAILNNPEAAVLYRGMRSTLPFIETMGKLTLVLNEAKLILDRKAINKNQMGIYLKDIQQQALETIRNSWFYRLLGSPWSGLVLGLLCIAVALVAMIPGAGVFLAAALLVSIIAVTAVTLAGTIEINKGLDELKAALKAAFGDVAQRLVDAFEELQVMLVVAAFFIILAVSLMLILSAYSGLKAAKGGGGTFKGGAEQWGKSMSENGGLGFKKLFSGPSKMLNQLREIINGAMMMFSAEFEHALAHLSAEVDQLRARSTFIDNIAEKVQSTLNKLLQYVQELAKSQSAMIKALGDTSTIVTRNFVI